MTTRRSIALLVAALITSACDAGGTSAPGEAPGDTTAAPPDTAEAPDTSSTAPDTAAARMPGARKAPARSDAPTFPSAALSESYDALLREADAAIEGARARTEAEPDSWPAWEALAKAWMRRGRLTGDFDAYAEAEAALTRAFEVARPRTGPFLTRAQFNLSMHRLERVEPDLAVADRLATLVGPSAMASARAELELQRGDYAAARERLAAALEDDASNFQARSRFALTHWKTGDFEAAEAQFRDALSRYFGEDPLIPAWTHLQLGLLDLDRARLDEARAHYEQAARHMPGWWLIEEHLVEIDVLEGRTEEAKAAYEDIVERTGNPEFMDALGELLAASNPEASETWIARARTLYEAQLERFPEAAYGHALGHFLTFAPDEAVTLELARENAALRPNGEALMSLAQAELAAGDVDAAGRAIEGAIATGYRSADLHVTAQEVFTADGDEAAAAEQCAAAEAIAPGACPDGP